jgi:ATP-binding cassette subfamily E protein 1
VLKILGGKNPNLGNWEEEPSWNEILNYFRGSELQNYLTNLLEEEYKTLIKPQYVDRIPKAVSGTVGQILTKKDQLNLKDQLIEELGLEPVLNRQINNLSGGELQRFAIAVTAMQDVNVYMFDEPSSYLDIKERMKVSQTIRRVFERNREKTDLLDFS